MPSCQLPFGLFVMDKQCGGRQERLPTNAFSLGPFTYGLRVSVLRSSALHLARCIESGIASYWSSYYHHDNGDAS